VPSEVTLALVGAGSLWTNCTPSHSLCDYIAETVDIIVSNKECDAVIREAVVCEEEAAALAAAAESAPTKNGEADSANIRRSCGSS